MLASAWAELNINEDILNECGGEPGKEAERKVLKVEREEQHAKLQRSKRIKCVQGLEQVCLTATLSTWPGAGTQGMLDKSAWNE